MNFAKYDDSNEKHIMDPYIYNTPLGAEITLLSLRTERFKISMQLLSYLEIIVGCFR